ncbi:MAG TPA: G1 family glutamic endopeptidase [Solirubrobacteraceae bacterium]|nr:G1 family glutamic endopeptidase [Solirubrobacteraceae bacterium]
MRNCKPTRWPARLLAVLVQALLLGAFAPSSTLAAPPAGARASVSANWAGYIAVPSTRVASRFSSVSASWRAPSAACSAGRETYSAVWVGLGGYSQHARALEQIGTDANCAPEGDAIYSSWYELVPAAPVNLPLQVRPGDEMSASVAIKSHEVALRISDLTTGAHFAKAVRSAIVDRSSAEWIVEAPSVCAGRSTCHILPLTDFGEVTFASAYATARSHTGTIVDPHWWASALQLRQHALTGGGGRPGTHTDHAPAMTLATPSSLSSSGGKFSVSWQEQLIGREQPSRAPPPGFGGGPG